MIKHHHGYVCVIEDGTEGLFLFLCHHDNIQYNLTQSKLSVLGYISCLSLSPTKEVVYGKETLYSFIQRCAVTYDYFKVTHI
jgi:hypothetical protein